MTVDDVCAEAGVSKGAFYGYFEQKQDLLLALLADDTAAQDRELERITATSGSPVERVRWFAQAMLARAEDPARVQVRTDLWADLSTEQLIRRELAQATHRQRECVRRWIDEADASGAIVAIPADALVSIVIALTEGLMLHGALDPATFRPQDVRGALDGLLAGLEARESRSSTGGLAGGARAAD